MYVDVAANAALGKSRGSKKKETAGLLRVMIREYREMQEYVQAGHRLPKGLNRITHAELLQTFEQWGVATKDSGRRRPRRRPAAADGGRRTAAGGRNSFGIN